jgi:hypothetical protein
MWELRAQYNRLNAENPSGVLEWSSVFVDTQDQADSWWRCRTSSKCKGRVSTMFDPDGNVVKVAFD